MLNNLVKTGYAVPEIRQQTYRTQMYMHADNQIDMLITILCSWKKYKL